MASKTIKEEVKDGILRSLVTLPDGKTCFWSYQRVAPNENESRAFEYCGENGDVPAAKKLTEEESRAIRAGSIAFFDSCSGECIKKLTIEQYIALQTGVITPRDVNFILQI